MKNNNSKMPEEIVIRVVRVKSSERECARCKAVLVHNENELCYECLNCGCIDCGDDDE